MKKFKENFMKTNNEIEKILLKDEKYEKLVSSKIEKDFENVLNEKTSQKPEIITEISEVPQGLLFSKSSTFEVINKTNKTKSFINGLQAEGFLGANDFERSKLLKGETNAFVRDNIFVKFVKCKIK